ncbi:transglycosylase domain-containing protein [Oceanobacillus manasiensis]|uniref:transglycosylase domain-containing protein n=1 Tax=Oceanobacillus manasiensis TaxID=586413 RepID=UPI000694B6B1|nr:PBP1A family penicillin-binding protein [Oceanobacillus manasiensis]
MKKERTGFKKGMPKYVKGILYSFVAILVLSLIGFTLILYGGGLVVDDEAFLLDSTTTIETEDGTVIGKLYNENRELVSIDRIPNHVKNAFVAIEDRRFYDHAGVDLRSVMRAIVRDIVAMKKVEGASTITQQLAKNLFLHHDKTIMRKTKEVMAAIYIEQNFTKDQILELYLNEIYFGKGIYGIETAANYFFSKPISELSIEEGALLAGLAKAPNGYSPIDHPDRALERRNVVLHSMENAGLLNTEKRLQAENRDLELQLNERKTEPFSDSYVDLVMKEAADKHNLSIKELKRGGYRIVVNMDANTQRIAYNQFQNEAYFPGNTEGVEGAFVMMEQETGRIVSALGGRSYQLGELNRAAVKRQPGSTFKPLAVYGPALMQESYTPYTLIPDKALDYNGYTATNADGQYDESVSIYNAIKYSKNAPAVWLLDKLGISYAKEYLEKLNLSIEDDGLAIALGGLTEGITPLNLMGSYSAFSRNGKMVDSHTIERIYDSNDELLFQADTVEKEVFTEQVAWDMTEILLETVENGTASAGSFSKALAGKTGTTQHPFVEGQVKDAWFAGYTPDYVMVTWMGYDQSDENHYLTGGSAYPTELTKTILTEVDKLNPLTETFTKPKNAVALEKPIELPEIENLYATYKFGGFSLVKAKLTWQGSQDERVVYRIYRVEDGIDKRVAEVEGETEYTISNALFKSKQYYITAYDPLTRLEGGRSDIVELSW